MADDTFEQAKRLSKGAKVMEAGTKIKVNSPREEQAFKRKAVETIKASKAVRDSGRTENPRGGNLPTPFRHR